MKRRRRVSVVLRLGFVLFQAAGLLIFLSEPILVCADSADPELSMAQSNARNERFLKREYAWKDINSARVIEIKQDHVTIDGRVPVRGFRIELLISVNKLSAAMQDYGIPDGWLRISYRGHEELRYKKQELINQAAARGIAFYPNQNALGVDYRWVVVRSHGDVRDAFEKLYDAAQKAEYRDDRRILGLFASFVQSLAYREQPRTRKGSDGSEVFVAGVSMPLETLANGYGDCDTKCLLFGALLTHFENAKMILIRGGGHVFPAVRTVPKPGDRYVRVRSERYVLVELTTPWLLGHIPAENWRGLQMKKFEIIPLI